MEVLNAVVGKLAEKAVDYTVAPIARQVGYLFSYKSKRQELDTQLDKLRDAREKVQRHVDEAKRNADDIVGEVESWLTEVNGKISAEAAQKLVDDEEKAKKWCLFGLCPDFMSRYKFSKKAVKEANSIAKLLEREGRFDGVSYRPTLEGMAPVKGYEEFESRRGAFDGVMEALKDTNLSLIGVYGMGGVGKTTLVKQVASQAKEKKLFDYVVMAALTQTPNVLNVQNEIAEKLGMKKFDVDSMDVRAGLLRKRLKEEKSTVLIILDDLWSPLNLDDLGVPSGDMGCKILMTSREFNILSRMNSEKCIPVDILKDDEAWKLFKKEVGVIVESSEVLPIATEVAKKCAGLPIAIATIGRALKDKNLTHWKNTLRELKRPSISNLKGIPEEVHKCIELSYGFLKSQELRSTFLLCSVLGHNAAVEDLLRYCKGLGLIHGVETIEEARDKLSTWIDELKASCLLLDGSTSGGVDIHDVVRDVAISIAARDNLWLALGRDDVSQDWSNEETMKNYKLISLQEYAKVSELIELDHELKFPQLTFFFMSSTSDKGFPWKIPNDDDEDSSLKIRNNFFLGMPKVKVLAFVQMHFPSLPSSIEFLKHLRTLCLRGCMLKDMAVIGELKNLEILDLSYTRVEKLSSEIGKLSRLSLLDLNNCFHLEFISPDVLSSLSKLEELYMESSFVEWEDGALGNRTNASLDELKQLTHLTTLFVHIPNAQIIPKHLFTQALERYRILIGDVTDPWFQYKYSRTLKVELDLYRSMDDGVKILVKKSEDLYLDLDQVSGMRNVFGELDNNGEDFSDLKRLHIKNGLEVQYIAMENNKFPQLQFITLEYLPQLISFCSEENRCPSSHQKEVARSSKRLPLFNKQLAFPKQLKSLIIEGCGNLHLLSASAARNLVHLTHFKIEDCRRLREIISTDATEQEDKVVIRFPQLSSVKLIKLKSLVNFCGGNYNIEFPALKVLKLRFCPVLKGFINEPEILEEKSLFNEKVAFPSLERLEILHLKTVKMIFRNQLLCQLKEMKVEGCVDLLTIFPVSIAKDLPQLETLEVSNCGVEEIVSAREVMEKPIEFEFPRVSYLVLEHLRELKCFYPEPHTIMWPMLEKLEIDDCFTLLKILGIQECGAGQPLFLVEKVTPMLKDLRLIKCSGDISKIFNGQFLQSFYNLEFFNCDFKHLVSLEGDYVEKSDSVTLTSSMVKKITLRSCKFVKHIWDKNSELGHILPTLGILEVYECFDLIIFGHFSASFQNLTTLILESCSRMKNLVSPSVVQNLVQLTTMEIGSCHSMIEIVANEGDEAIDEITFRMLKCLELYDLDNLENFCLGKYTIDFPCLQDLTVDSCNNLKIFSKGVVHSPQLQRVKKSRWFDGKWCWAGDLNTTIQQLYDEEVAEYHELQLSDIVPELMEKWNGRDPQQDLGFKSLQCLEVCNCSNLRLNYILTLSMTFSLNRLEKLVVKECSALEDIIVEQHSDEEELATTHNSNFILFPKLESIEIKSCSNLISFYLGSRALQFPLLETIKIANCPKMSTFSRDDKETEISADGRKSFVPFFYDKAVCPQLTQLMLSSLNIQMMWDHQQLSSALCFQNLKYLRVKACHNLIYLFPSSILKHFMQLGSLEIFDCEILEEVISMEGLTKDERMRPMLFPQLHTLKLENLPKLSRFCYENYIEFPCLKELTLENCSLKTFPFKQTENAQGNQGEISALFNEKAVCPQLKWLTLSLLNIQMMWDHQQLPSSLCFQNLKYLSVKACHNLIYLFPSSILKHFVQLKHLHICECKIMEEVIFMEGLTEDERMRPMLFPQLHFLELEDLPKLSRFCYENYIEFPYLQFLTLKNCSLLKSFLSKQTENAQENQVEISALFSKKVILPRLEYLTIKNMPNCRKIWADQITENSFFGLREMKVKSCGKLLNIFPLNMMGRLDYLKELQIVDCDSLQEIVKPQTIIANQSQVVASTQSIVEETVTKFVFLSVTKLRFEKLPKLKSFYSSTHSTEWPSLKGMEVTECHNVQIFASGCSGLLGETDVASQAEISNRQALFWVNEVTFRVLEKLTVTHGQILPIECIRKLKVLELVCVPQESTALPHCIFPSLANLGIKLVVKDASFCQIIFQIEGLSNDERYASALTRLSSLRLSRLPELTHLWKEEFQPTKAFNGLKILEVQDCGKLKTLAPYLMSFNNLTSLEVLGCHGFTNLITCSTAKRLMQLERMSIIDCEKIEEIIAWDADEILEDIIVFPQLSHLELRRLPSLASFCLGDCSFEFSILQKVIVNKCPKMKIFCLGDLSTPMLRQVQLTRNGCKYGFKGRWEGDLNTTIRQLFEERNVQNSQVTEE